MKVVWSWLRELCPTDLSAEDLADRLTARGVKVEGILRPWEGLRGVVVARVLEVVDHPNSEKLCVTRVTDGRTEAQVLAGVRNMRAGDLVPWARPGDRVPVLDEPLGVRRLRGEESNGMLCSPREIGISGDHGGILVLPADAPVGADLAATYGLDDAVLDIEVKSNRPDLLSVLGVAREAAAAAGVPLVLPATSVPEAEDKAADAATVEIRDPDGCPRYLARVVRGTGPGPSPLRVQARLTASGMRPVSSVVDATNYAMLELGQPMHPFDLSRLAGRGIVVRRAEVGEPLVTLDGVERVLGADDLVIADLEKAVGIAGVMGSADAEVSPRTALVLMESAHFAPTGVLRTSRRLGLVTEASTRFGRGADPEIVAAAADRAVRLMVEWGGGEVLAGAVDVGGPPERRRVWVRPDRTAAILGYPVAAADVLASLEELGLPADAGPEGIEVTVPGSRWDLRIEEDLIEEAARVLGYDRVPETLPAVAQAGGLAESHRVRRAVRDGLVRAGLRETISYTFASRDDLDLMGTDPKRPVRVANPLAADQEYLRTSLLPALFRAAARNLGRHVSGVGLFEVGRVFTLDDGVVEEERAALVLGGRQSSGFPGDGHPTDFFDGKGALEAVLASLGVRDWTLGEPAAAPYHPARSATVLVAGRAAGVVGEVHPGVARRLDLPKGTVAAELLVAELVAGTVRGLAVREIPRFPPVRRDLAFVVDREAPAGAVEAAIRDAGGDLLDAVVLFDLFEGAPVPEGRKSLAFGLEFRAPDRTLTDEEAEAAVARVVERVARDFGGELRSG